MLAVSAAEFNVIREAYPELKISANMGDYNVIDVTTLTVDALNNAISQSAASTKNDLVVLRTSASASRLTLQGAEISVNINASAYGSVTVVSFGEKPLTIDATNQSRAFSITGTSNVSLVGLSIVNGFSDDNGGAILQQGGTLTIDRCVFQDNTAMSGGAIFQEVNASTTIYNSTFAGNNATEMGGGGITQNGPSLTIVNSTFTENTAKTYGGAIFSFPEVGDSLSVVNCTIVANMASGRGGGIAGFDGTVNIYNTILYGNTNGGEQRPQNFFGADASLIAKSSIIENLPSGTGVTNGADGNQIGVDPKLHAKKVLPNEQVVFGLQNDSSAINAGNNSLLPSGVIHDQVGNPRIIQSNVDIGAFERNPPTAKINDAAFLSVRERCNTLVSASDSTDPLMQGLIYCWDVDGKGMFTESSNSTVWFDAEKLNGKPSQNQAIRLKVRDAEGTESEVVTANVSILDVMPTYQVSQPSELVAGRFAQWEFAANDTASDPIMKWAINWGDGSETVVNGGPLSRIFDTHFYRESKSYTITIKTTDIDGVESSAKLGIYVKLPPAVQQAASHEIPAAELYTHNADYSSKSWEDTTIAKTNADDTMRLRQMLDLDQSRESKAATSVVDFIWADDGSLFVDWIDFANEWDSYERTDVFEEELLKDLVLIG